MTDFSAETPLTWTRSGLEAAGYEGFVPFEAVRQGVTRQPGIYVVLRGATEPPAFLSTNPAGKRKDFTASAERLEQKWIADAEVVYIGLATHGTSRNGIHRRLNQFRRTGEGASDNHGGGVWIFQLAEAADLVVCWRAAEDESDEYVKALEHHLIEDFKSREEHRGWPFANRKA